MASGAERSNQPRPEMGKKVFFLYPHSVLGDELLQEILKEEYQVYFLKDHAKAPRLLAEFPGSILFANLDTGMEEKEWEKFLRGLMAGESTGSTGIGVLTYNNDPALSAKYLMEIGIPCGFVHLKQGLREATRIILKILEANEARGRRRFVRARCAPGAARFNAKHMGKILQGDVLDISSAGMACSFHAADGLTADAILDDIQLRLRGALCRAAGKLMGSVQENPSRRVMLFTQPLPEESLARIRMFVSLSLQDEMEEILKKL